MPTVSVIVATFDGPFLGETLETVRGQAFDDFEVLVMDDSKSSRVERLVGALDDRFRYVRNEVRLGVAANHGKGIALARGEYLAIINHDDLWHPELLARLVAGADAHPEVVGAFSRTLVAGPDGRYDADRTRRAWKTWKMENLPAGVIDNWFLTSGRLGFPVVASSILRAANVGRCSLPTIVGGAYDHWLGYRMARQGPVLHVEDAIGYWREHDGNLTRVRSARQALELVYIDSRAAVDRAIPGSLRRAAMRRLPAEIAHLGWNAVQPRQQSR